MKIWWEIKRVLKLYPEYWFGWTEPKSYGEFQVWLKERKKK